MEHAQMASQESRLVIDQDGEVTTVGFLDRNILEEASIQQIGDEIGALILASPNPKILLNFENVEHLSSAALGTLITINNNVKKQGGQLRLANIDPQIYEVFVITKLNKLFVIHDDNAAALASFK
jgi:anti-sigma B factor antagonist